MADLIDVKIGGTSVITSGKIVQNCTLSAALLTSGSLDGDRLSAPTSTKRGGVKATGTPSGLFYRDDDTWAAATAGAHALDSTNNTVSGRTAGQVVRMTGATTYEIAALQISDLPTITVAKGGLNLTSAATGTIPYASSTDTYSSLAGPGAANYVLRSTGSNAFSWGALTITDIPTITIAKGGTGQSTVVKGDMIIGSGADATTKLTVGTNNYILVADSSATTGVKWASDVIAITYIIDGGGSAITTGVKGFIEVPFACTITGWTLMADVSGSITIDTWKDTYANFPPTVLDTMWGTKPALSSVQKNQATGLSISVAAGSIIGFNVDSATTVTRVTLNFTATKSR